MALKVEQKPMEAQLVDLINHICVLNIHARIMACPFCWRDSLPFRAIFLIIEIFLEFFHQLVRAGNEVKS